jgi:hypothetical protein
MVVTISVHIDHLVAATRAALTHDAFKALNALDIERPHAVLSRMVVRSTGRVADLDRARDRTSRHQGSFGGGEGLEHATLLPFEARRLISPSVLLLNTLKDIVHVLSNTSLYLTVP